MNDPKMIRAYQQSILETVTALEGQKTSLPKQDKIVEWALLEIVLTLNAINSHLATIASRNPR